MDWAHPFLLLLIVPAVTVLWWLHTHSSHPMPPRRRRALLFIRSTLVGLALLALAGPAIERQSTSEAIIFILDHSASEGTAGLTRAREAAARLSRELPAGTQAGFVSVGEHVAVLREPSANHEVPASAADLPAKDGAQSDLASAISVARALLPAGASHRLVLLSDGNETRGDLETAAREAALAGVRLDAVPVAGEPRPDVRAVSLTPSKARLHEGATVDLVAQIESSMAGTGRVRLFENSIEVETRPLTVELGKTQSITFQRTPEQRNLYNFRIKLEGFAGDSVPENNEALALVDVRGRPLLLYVEGEPGEAHYLVDAMAREGLRLQTRPPESIPTTLQDLNGYDAIILSDVAAHRLQEKTMTLLKDYVEKLGGGLVMIGGTNSFGVGGYYRTPIEDMLPVKIRAPDQEERQSVALAMVMDRSGSMSGEKIELCKSAAAATVELMAKQDYVTVVAFDSEAHVVVPMSKRGDNSAIAAQIASIDAGGGTNIQPGMVFAQQALAQVNAKVKHMIVLTDGQSEGSGYESFAAQLKADGVTVSTVGVGSDADISLLQGMANAGGGQCYANVDPAAITRIFTQDAMKHMGRLVREEEFAPRLVERHAMLKDWDAAQAPALLGYVKTTRKATAQVPLVTDLNDPLLAQWRFGLGKVTAFTSDCKSRWASLWITGWAGYGQFWSQVLRDTARDAQSDEMDLRLESSGDRLRVVVDVMENAASFRNNAVVDADVSFAPASALGSALKPVAKEPLAQEASGRYAGDFQLGAAGVYLVRVRSGGQMITGGLVRNISGETATGRVNTALLERAAALTGGKLLALTERTLPKMTAARTAVVDLSGPILVLLILLFLGDLAVRRWENLQSLAEAVYGWRKPN